MSTKEVEAELLITLWTAWEAYDKRKGTTFGQFFWVCWIRKKSKLTAAYYKQQVFELVDPLFLPEQEEPAIDYIPICPANVDEVGKQVWQLIALGETYTNIQKSLGIGRTKFENYLYKFYLAMRSSSR